MGVRSPENVTYPSICTFSEKMFMYTIRFSHLKSFCNHLKMIHDNDLMNLIYDNDLMNLIHDNDLMNLIHDNDLMNLIHDNDLMNLMNLIPFLKHEHTDGNINIWIYAYKQIHVFFIWLWIWDVNTFYIWLFSELVCLVANYRNNDSYKLSRRFYMFNSLEERKLDCFWTTRNIEIAQPKPRPALPGPTTNLGTRVGTNLLLLSLSLSLCTLYSALKSAIYSGSYG